MKNAYLFIAFLVASASVYGKGEYQAMVTVGPVVNGKFPHFGNQVINAGGPGTTPANANMQVVARAYAVFDGASFVQVDSYYYNYDDRSSVLNNKDIDNDEALLYSESLYFIFDKTSGKFVNRLKRTQDYYSDDKVKFLTYQPWNSSVAVWDDSARYGYTYDNNGRMKESTFEQYYAGMWTNSISSSIQYTGQLVTAMESPTYKVSFLYDNSLRLSEMTDVQYIAGMWQNQEKHTYAYTAGNDVDKHVLYEWNALISDWTPKKSWQYTYSGSDVLSETNLEWNGSGWVNVSMQEYKYDANHNMVTSIKKIWNGTSFVESSKEDWVYNSQNLPDLITTSTWNGSGWNHALNDRKYKIYYRAYFPSSVNELADNSGLTVYPVPATNVLNIDIKLANAEDVSIALIDVKGVVVYTSEHNSTKTIHTSVPVAALAAGTYFLRAVGSSTNTTKQVVVQH